MKNDIVYRISFDLPDYLCGNRSPVEIAGDCSDLGHARDLLEGLSADSDKGGSEHLPQPRGEVSSS